MDMNSGIQKTWLIPPEEHLTLRTSFIKMFLRCPAQAMFRYFKGLIVLPRSYTTVGTCLHKSAEYQNIHKMKKGRDAKLSVLQDVFSEEWKERIKKTEFKKEEDPIKIKDHSVRQVIPVYHEEIGKKVEPILIEEPFAIEFPAVNATITGTIDLVESRHIIRDLKTKSKTPNWMDILKSVQSVSYWLGYEAKFGKVPTGFVLDYLIRSKEPKYEHSPLKQVKPNEVEQYVTLVQNIVLQVRQGLFYPKRENNHLCSPHMCGYWDRCMAGGWMEQSYEGRTFMGNDGVDEPVETEATEE